MDDFEFDADDEGCETDDAANALDIDARRREHTVREGIAYGIAELIENTVFAANIDEVLRLLYIFRNKDALWEVISRHRDRVAIWSKLLASPKPSDHDLCLSMLEEAASVDDVEETLKADILIALSNYAPYRDNKPVTPKRRAQRLESVVELLSDGEANETDSQTAAAKNAVPDFLEGEVVDVQAVLRKFAGTEFIDYSTVLKGNASPAEIAFHNRLREAVEADNKRALIADRKPDGGKSDTLVPREDAEVREQVFAEQRKAFETLLADEVLTPELLLKIGFGIPDLIVPILEATVRVHHLNAVAWLLGHAGGQMRLLAVRLGYPDYQRTSQDYWRNSGQLLLQDRSPNVECDNWHWYRDSGTVSRDWFEEAISPLTSLELSVYLKAMKAVVETASMTRLRAIIDAFQGNVTKENLIARIKDRRNVRVLQLALLPLSEEPNARTADISQRLAVFDRLAAVGRRKKTLESRANIKQAVNQARRSLASNAGLADVTQLDWINGKVLALDIAHFDRLEHEEYVIQLSVSASGVKTVISKAGKRLKSIPSKIKKSDEGDRLAALTKRIENSLRDFRAAFEESMILGRPYSSRDIEMAMSHPAAAAILSETVLQHKDFFGCPSADGKSLIGPDGQTVNLANEITIPHPLILDDHDKLSEWQVYFADRSPQAFQQVDRAFSRLADLKTAKQGLCIVRCDGIGVDQLQFSRVLQAHGWEDNRSFGMSKRGPDCVAIVEDALLFAGSSIGDASFRGPKDWNSPQPVTEVDPIFLSEVIRDIDRAITASIV